MLRAKLLQSLSIYGFPCLNLARLATIEAEVPAVRTSSCSPRQLLVDVSIIAERDAGTGIQRTVRSLLLELLKSPPQGFAVFPVWATKKTNYRHANAYLSQLTGKELVQSDNLVVVGPEDVFLGLDLGSRYVSSKRNQFIEWRHAGVKICFVIYDLLPALHPYWFTKKSQNNFLTWLKTISLNSDAIFSISNTVRQELRNWIDSNKISAAPRLESFYLGAEKREEIVDECTNSIRDQISALLDVEKSILMVGTIEPRKGHELTLAAFEFLWQRGHNTPLIIVGREGWHSSALARKIREHPEYGRKILWLENADDSQLSWLYQHSFGLLLASEAEGFGLPIIEAARWHAPLLLSDIPVFREIASSGATFFQSRTALELSEEIIKWIESVSLQNAPNSDEIHVLDWRQSAKQLSELVLTTTQDSKNSQVSKSIRHA